MTNEKILTKAIGKALKNGWEIPERFDTPWEVVELGDESVILEYGDSFVMLELSMPEIVFSHDFAKAFFGIGDDLWTKDDPRHNDSKLFKNFRRYFYYNEATEEEGEWVLPKWKQCLQQMVVSENPLQYLKTYMEEFNV